MAWSIAFGIIIAIIILALAPFVFGFLLIFGIPIIVIGLALWFISENAQLLSVGAVVIVLSISFMVFALGLEKIASLGGISNALRFVFVKLRPALGEIQRIQKEKELAEIETIGKNNRGQCCFGKRAS
jgi:hypothetical protein